MGAQGNRGDRWGHRGTGGRVGGADMWAGGTGGGTGGQVWGQDMRGTGGRTGGETGDRGQVGGQGTDGVVHTNKK